MGTDSSPEDTPAYAVLTSGLFALFYTMKSWLGKDNNKEGMAPCQLLRTQG